MRRRTAICFLSVVALISLALLTGCIEKEGAASTPTPVPTSTPPLTPTPEAIEKVAKENLSSVEVAVLYEYVTDGVSYGRSVDDVANLLNETKTDFIFRGFWRWSPCPESADMIPPGYPEWYPEYAKTRAKEGYTYQQLREAIVEIKKKNPDIIFCGAIPAQRITIFALDPISGDFFGAEDTWDMALDPRKWDISSISKEEYQCWYAKKESWIDQSFDCKNYNPQQVASYFPDITNEKFQELLLSWAKKQIDCGADAIWIDFLFYQAEKFAQITGNVNHPAVKESYEAASKIVNEIHSYGKSSGKYIYVGSWGTSLRFPYPQPNLDFVTISPSSDEVRSKRIDETKERDTIARIRRGFGDDVPIFMFIDWASSVNTPLGVFSQSLTPSEQKDFLRATDKFCQNAGINFVYPVHGGFMGYNSKKLSFGKFTVYDSTAPEFKTSETIKELAWDK